MALSTIPRVGVTFLARMAQKGLLALIILDTCILCVSDTELIYGATGGTVKIPVYNPTRPQNGIIICEFRKDEDSPDIAVMQCEIQSSKCIFTDPYNPRSGFNFSSLTVTLRNLSNEDSGSYRCKLLKDPHDTNPIVTVSYLKVVDPISGLTLRANSNQLGHSVQLQCEFSGNYTGIKWEKKDGIVPPNYLQQDNRFIIIEKADASHCGYYICVVQTHTGDFQTGTELTLHGSLWYFHTKALSICSTVFALISLTCSICLCLRANWEKKTMTLICSVTNGIGILLTIIMLIFWILAGGEVLPLSLGIFSFFLALVPAALSVHYVRVGNSSECIRNNTALKTIIDASVLGYVPVLLVSIIAVFMTSKVIESGCGYKIPLYLIITCAILPFLISGVLFGIVWRSKRKDQGQSGNDSPVPLPVKLAEADKNPVQVPLMNGDSESQEARSD